MWESIRANKRKSVLIICLMGVLLVALGGSIGGAVFGVDDLRGVVLGIFIASVIWFILTLVSLYQGRNILLAVSGAREVKHDDAPQLSNIVEEMRIAAALPSMPKVFIMEERSPNAFAVGTPEDSAVAVTTGLLSSSCMAVVTAFTTCRVAGPRLPVLRYTRPSGSNRLLARILTGGPRGVSPSGLVVSTAPE